jgi:hypothetical protein
VSSNICIDDIGIGCPVYPGFVCLGNVGFFDEDLGMSELLIVEVGGIHVVRVGVGWVSWFLLFLPMVCLLLYFWSNS